MSNEINALPSSNLNTTGSKAGAPVSTANLNSMLARQTELVAKTQQPQEVKVSNQPDNKDKAEISKEAGEETNLDPNKPTKKTEEQKQLDNLKNGIEDMKKRATGEDQPEDETGQTKDKDEREVDQKDEKGNKKTEKRLPPGQRNEGSMFWKSTLKADMAEVQEERQMIQDGSLNPLEGENPLSGINSAMTGLGARVGMPSAAVAKLASNYAQAKTSGAPIAEYVEELVQKTLATSEVNPQTLMQQAKFITGTEGK